VLVLLITINIILNSFFDDFSFLTLKSTFAKKFKGVQFIPPLELGQKLFYKNIQTIFEK